MLTEIWPISDHFLRTKYYCITVQCVLPQIVLDKLSKPDSKVSDIWDYFQTLSDPWDKQCRPRSNCFWRSSLIRVFPVCYSDKHFANSSPEKQHIIWEQKEVCSKCKNIYGEPVWSGSSLFAILTSILRILALKTNILSENRKRCILN